MAGGAYVALSGLRSRSEHLDRLASDLANAGTSGYKAERSTTSAAERDTFGSFILPGDVPLGELAGFYSLPMPKRIAGKTAAELFDERFDRDPQVGDRLAIGSAILVVREVRDDRASKIGLRFAGVGERLISG